MSDLIYNTTNLLNYELQSSNSTNYGMSQSSSSPESFPSQMLNGIIVKYESVVFSSKLIKESSELTEVLDQ